ncbi:unnamed protein product [Arabidopsis halleri]
MGEVAATIRSIFERDFKEPHANWTQTPSKVIDRWFETFAQTYNWDQSINARVRAEFDKKLKSRMCDQVSRWKKKWKRKGDDAKPKWIDPDVWAALVRYWRDPKSEAKSINSRNARYHDPDGTGIHKHRSGQTSFKARARKHAEKTGVLTPDFLQILEETHRKADGTFIDGKSESIYNEVSSRIQEIESELCAGDNMESSASGGLSIHTKNKIYTEVAPRKKNRIYGVGSLRRKQPSAHTGPLPPPLEDPLILSRSLLLLKQVFKLRLLKYKFFKLRRRSYNKVKRRCIAMMLTSSTLPRRILHLLFCFEPITTRGPIRSRSGDYHRDYTVTGDNPGNGGKVGKTGLTGTVVGVDVTASEKLWRSFQAVGDIAFSYAYSIVLVEIQACIYDTLKSTPPENKVMKKASLAGVSTTTVFYILCGGIGYAAFGNKAPGDLLTDFGFYEPYWLIDFANACIVLHLIAAYQVFAQPIFQFVEKKCNKKWPENNFITSEHSMNIPLIGKCSINLFRLLWRTAYVVLTTVVAMIFPFFNAILGLLGALTFWPLTVYFPVAMHIEQAKVKKYSLRWIGLKILVSLCLIVSVLATIGSIVGLITSVKAYKPFNN